MAKTVINSVINNSRTLSGMQKRRNSSIVTIVGQEHSTTNGVAYFALSPDLSIISELRFKIIGGAFSNVVLDGSLSLGWSGTGGVDPDDTDSGFFDLLQGINGTSFARTLFDGGLHTLTVVGGGEHKILLYAKYSARNR